jgi:hypothetical protein
MVGAKAHERAHVWSAAAWINLTCGEKSRDRIDGSDYNCLTVKPSTVTKP